MHYKAAFALAGVFLAVAMVVPLAILITQGQQDLIVIQNPVGMQTSGNTSSASGIISPGQVETLHINNIIIIAIVEAIFIPLFVLTLYYGINHVHPGHKKPE